MAISKSFIQKTLKRNFPKFGNLIVESTFIKFDNQAPDYDPDIGIINDTSVTFSIGAIYADFSFTKNQSGFKEIENSNILQKDKKAIIQFIDFPVSIKPEIDDILINTITAIEYFVVGANIDPADAVYVLHIRPKEE